MRNIIFYLVLIIAAIGLVMNLDAFIFSIVRMLISFAVIAGIIYLIYYFFILTE
ncbi:SA1362 family protein, partial [Staphylococcus aureus]